MENLNWITVLIPVVIAVVGFCTIKVIKNKTKNKQLNGLDFEYEEYENGEESFYTLQEFFSPDNNLYKNDKRQQKSRESSQVNKNQKQNKEKYKKALREADAEKTEKNIEKDKYKTLSDIKIDIPVEKEAVFEEKEIIYKRKSEITQKPKDKLIKTELFLSFDDNTQAIRPAFNYNSLNGYRLLYDVDLLLKRDGKKEIFIDKNNDKNNMSISNSYYSLMALVEDLLTRYNVDINNVFKTQIGVNKTDCIGMISMQQDGTVLAVYCVDVDNICRVFELRFTREDANIWANRFKAMLNSITFDNSLIPDKTF